MFVARALSPYASRQKVHPSKCPRQGAPDLIRKEVPMTELHRLSILSH
jgi:hypothetical protein